MNNEQQKLCEEIWREYEAYIIKLCNAKLSSHLDEAAELVSEVYEALCEAIDAGKNINNPKPWLYSVANNKLKEKYTEINRKKHLKQALILVIFIQLSWLKALIFLMKWSPRKIFLK